jgi:hypothetical protein
MSKKIVGYNVVPQTHRVISGVTGIDYLQLTGLWLVEGSDEHGNIVTFRIYAERQDALNAAYTAMSALRRRKA